MLPLPRSLLLALLLACEGSCRLLTRSVTAVVTSSNWDSAAGGSVTVEVTRTGAVCCSEWDWVGIYQSGVRLAFVHSSTLTPSFTAQFAIPSGPGGIYSFQYSTSLDGWQVHDLGLELTFGEAPAVPVGCLIPSYWWPTNGNWDLLTQALSASGLPASRVTVILNVNNGYNTDPTVVTPSVWLLWQDRAEKLYNAGFKVLAYVNLCSDVVSFTCTSTANQGNRPFAEVQPEIAKYVAELGQWLGGLFLDDAGHSGLTTTEILQVTTYANGLGLQTVHNPGAFSQDTTLFNAADVTVMRENSDAGTASPYFSGFGVEKSAMILHSVDATAWSGYLDAAKALGYGHFYATSGGWDSVPSYLGSLLTALHETSTTTTAAPTTTSGDPHAVGDPHLMNIKGEHFDVSRPGAYALLQVPRGAAAPDSTLRVEASIERLGSGCEDMYIRSLRIAGRWAEEVGGPISFRAGEDDFGNATSGMALQGSAFVPLEQLASKPPRKMRVVLKPPPSKAAGMNSQLAGWVMLPLGPANASVYWAHRGTKDGRQVGHLNFRIHGLGQAAAEVGGILGIDDHSLASVQTEECRVLRGKSLRGQPPTLARAHVGALAPAGDGSAAAAEAFLD